MTNEKSDAQRGAHPTTPTTTATAVGGCSSSGGGGCSSSSAHGVCRCRGCGLEAILRAGNCPFAAEFLPLCHHDDHDHNDHNDNDNDNDNGGGGGTTTAFSS